MVSRPSKDSKQLVCLFQAERYEVEVDETRITHAADVFGKYLKSDDLEAVSDVVTKEIIDDASSHLESKSMRGDYRYFWFLEPLAFKMWQMLWQLRQRTN